MTLTSKYAAFAKVAARVVLGVGPKVEPDHRIVTAILAHWTCEQSGSWPPVHDNPGFVSVGALASVNVKAAPAVTTPGIGFLAQFRTPRDGATAYGLLVARGHRYAPAVARARAGDGAGYLRAITKAGYGTRQTCVLDAFKRLTANEGK